VAPQPVWPFPLDIPASPQLAAPPVQQPPPAAPVTAAAPVIVATPLVAATPITAATPVTAAAAPLAAAAPAPGSTADPAPVPAPAIRPSTGHVEPEPQARPRQLGPALVGLFVGLLIFGSTGYLIGVRADDGASPTTAVAGTASADGFAVRNAAIRAGIDPALLPVAESWLPFVESCTDGDEPAGPRPQPGEEARLSCRVNGLDLGFIRYASVADRNRAAEARRRQNAAAAMLTPGIAAPGRGTAAAGRVNGNYIEYATGPTAAGAPTVSGIWWDDTETPVAAYLETAWQAGAGGSWDTLREVWRRLS
jgi:hypothetical protein